MYALYCTKNVLQKSTKNWIQYLLDAILVHRCTQIWQPPGAVKWTINNNVTYKLSGQKLNRDIQNNTSTLLNKKKTNNKLCHLKGVQIKLVKT